MLKRIIIWYLKRHNNFFYYYDDTVVVRFTKDYYDRFIKRKQGISRGKWLLEKEPNGKPYCFHCSVCDRDFHNTGIKTAYDYCPNCGSKMDKEC